MGFNWFYNNIYFLLKYDLMLDQINNFAGFNLAAILFALIGGGIFMIIFHYLLMPIFTFILINLILGCDTWDQELWTEYNSCILPSQIMHIFLP